MEMLQRTAWITMGEAYSAWCKVSAKKCSKKTIIMIQRLEGIWGGDGNDDGLDGGDGFMSAGSFPNSLTPMH